MSEHLERRERWVGAPLKTQVPLNVINGSLDTISGIEETNRFREIVTNPDVADLPDAWHYDPSQHQRFARCRLSKERPFGDAEDS